MNDDILKDAIENVVKELVYDYVKVDINVVKYSDITNYEIELSYGVFHTVCKLFEEFSTSKAYITRVVSDLCNNLAKHFDKERDFFFKRSDINE